MSGQIYKLEASEHQAVQELLTWHASGALAPDEAQRVSRHLQDCAQCRHDLQGELALFEQLRSAPQPDQASAADAALARLLPQLALPAAALPHPPATSPTASEQPLPWWRQPAANAPAWLRWAALGQAVLIAGLTVLLVRAPVDTGYHALGADASAETGNTVVMFRPGTTEHEMRRLLLAHQGRIVDGPSQNGSYVLYLPKSGRMQALQDLRAHAAVTLAEPLDSEAAP